MSLPQTTPKRRRGAQPGNRNAWRHGRYSAHRTPDGDQLIEQSLLDRYIAILDASPSNCDVVELLSNDPEYLSLELRASVRVLVKLLRHKFAGRQLAQELLAAEDPFGMDQPLPPEAS